MTDRLYHKRHRDFEYYDRIEFGIVPRFKTSGLSGDEWRHTIVVRFYFKGVEVRLETYGDMKAAAAHLPGIFYSYEPIPEAVIAREKDCCDQPGCEQKWVGRFELKRQTAPTGEWLDASESSLRYYRQFCLKHIERGDCSREDADRNYIPLDKAGPADSQNAEESPAVFGGFIDGEALLGKET